MKKNYVKTDYYEMWVEHGIVNVVYVRNLKLDIHITKKLVNQRIEICEGKSYPLFTNMNQAEFIDVDARIYLASEGVKNLNAVAVLVHSKWDYILSSIFLFAHKFPLPFDFFIDRYNAIKWLERYKQDDYSTETLPCSLSS